MKNYITVLTFFFSLISYSQKIEIKNPITVKYLMTLDFDGTKNYDCILNFNEAKSFFEWNEFEKKKKTKEEIGNEISKGNVSIDITDKSSLFIFSDNKNNILYEKKPKLDEQFILKEKIEIISWKRVDSTKIIGNFNCKLAFSNFRGRKYFAWYTTDIPAFSGPWKLQGLPGLIIEAYDSTGEVYIIASEIKNKDITLQENVLNNSIVLNKAEWLKKKNEYKNNLKSKLFRNLPRSATINNLKIKEKKDFEIN
jgi:GLPGLI family protein